MTAMDRLGDFLAYVKDTFSAEKAPFQLKRQLFSVHITITSTAKQSVSFYLM
jgi:hypothetical protein